MSIIVKNWIGSKLGLELPSDPDPSAFRYEVANGVLIAEILRKYGLLSDDEYVSLRHDNSAKSRAANMQHVHNWLTNAGMDLDDELMTDVAEEKPGCAAKFLYELFLWLEDGPRKPQVGDKAKKYLTDHHFKITSKSSEPVLEQRRESRKERLSSLSNAWLQSVQVRESETAWKGEAETEVPVESSEAQVPAADAVESELMHEKSKKGHTNWFTTLDSQPTIKIGISGPYNELSETAQAELVYFTQRAIDIVKDQEAFKNEIRAAQRKKLDAQAEASYDEVPILEKDSCIFRTKEEIAADRATRARQEEERLALEEIRKFDSKLRKKKLLQKSGKVDHINVSGETIGSKGTMRIYRNGKGCEAHFQKSLQQLKLRRLQEVKEDQERSKWRQATLNHLIQEIPGKMVTNMKNGVLQLACTSLSTQEQSLTDFIHFGHQEKEVLVQHARFESMQLKNAKRLDMEKAAQIEKGEEELQRLLGDLDENSLPDHDTNGGKEASLFARAEKSILVHDILENMLSLVSQLAEYRMPDGSPLGQEYFNNVLEGKEVGGPKVVLNYAEQKFVLETQNPVGHEQEEGFDENVVAD